MCLFSLFKTVHGLRKHRKPEGKRETLVSLPSVFLLQLVICSYPYIGVNSEQTLRAAP